MIRMNLLLKMLLLAAPLAAPAATTRDAAGSIPGDATYFADKRALLTARWDTPFDYASIRSNHAPLGPFMGNGDVGCVAYTAHNSQTLLISKVDFVTDGHSDWAGSGAAALPVGGVRIAVSSPQADGFCYRMDMLANRLDMTSGTTAPVKFSSWMAPTDNYVVTELTSAAATPVTIRVTTFAGGTSTAPYGKTAALKNEIAQLTRRTRTQNVEWISQAGLSTRVLQASSQAEVVADSAVCHTFSLAPGGKAYVVTYVSGGGMTDDARLPEALRKLRRLNVRGIERLRREKEQWWHDMWCRSYVETGDSLLNRQYLASIYLMASAYNRHSPACGGMYGVWNMNDNMMYHGDIHLNYNSQAGFYSAFSANRPELALPFVDFVERMMPDGVRRAREDMGAVHPSLKGKSCRGLLFPVSALGIGRFYGGYWQQTMNAPFCMPIFSWYYEYTADRDFLARHAYPYIRACGDFYEDYLTRETRPDGTYRYTIITGGHENSWDVNPPSDLAFVEQTFSLLLRYSRILNTDADRRARWLDILTHLPGYKVIQPTKTPNQGLPVFAKNEDGWDLPAHLIQMHALYPCEVMDLDSDPDTLQIARNTIYYYGVSQNGLTGTMNELGLSAFVMGARAGFSPDILVEKMKQLIAGARPNFLITDDHHCLEKTAVVETINSMMLQSTRGVLRLFPNWLPRPASITRLRAKGAYLVTAAYDGRQVTLCQIQATHADTCRLRNPWPGRSVRVTDQRNGRDVTTTEAHGVISFAAQAGHSYQIQQH